MHAGTVSVVSIRLATLADTLRATVGLIALATARQSLGSTTGMRLALAVIALLLGSTAASATALADGQRKFLGSAFGANQAPEFARYWNKLTPENAGKWGSVESVRDQMDWAELDRAYAFARSNGFPFHFHVLVWGNQQPEWIRHLPPAEQREEIVEWFAAVAQRYPDLDIVEVVNEPLHDPPCSDDADGGNYCEALGGAGDSGWDWIVESFRLAREHFPKSQLLLNDFSITSTPRDARRYRGIVDLLRARGLIDAIGVQGHAFSTSCEHPAEVHREVLDMLAGAGLPIHVTELDIDGYTDADQLAHIQRVFPIFWEHPAVAGVTLWGFRPGLWRDAQGAYLIDRQGRERPALAWLREYVAGKVKATPEPCPAPASVLDHPITGALALIDNGRPLPMRVAGDGLGDVRRAADAAQERLRALAGNAPDADGRNAILVGTLGHHEPIDRLVREGKLDVADVEGRPSAYLLQIVYQPAEGVEHALVIVGADREGTLGGLDELIRRLGSKRSHAGAAAPNAPSAADIWIAPGRFVAAVQHDTRAALRPEDPRDRDASRQASDAPALTLKQAFADAFRVGVAVSDDIVTGRDAASQPVVAAHFNSITAENVMKAEVVNPEPGVYDFAPADAFVAYGERLGMHIVGHTLVWHNQTPAFFFQDENGNPHPREALIERMRSHIEAVAGRYRGRVHAWDVVNEVIDDDGSYRPTSWVQGIGDGDTLVRTAFAFAQQYAPDAELYYNDFNAWRPEKRDGIVRMVRMLQTAGIRIDGIGMQGHWGLNYPDSADIESAIDAYAALGVKVMITELDVDVLPLTREGQIIGTGMLHKQFQLPEFKRYLDPYASGLPDPVQQQLAQRYADLFAIFLRKRDRIARVALWGVHDGMSWKNNYPIPNRTNHPLLFDRQRQPKAALDAVLKLTLDATANEAVTR